MAGLGCYWHEILSPNKNIILFHDAMHSLVVDLLSLTMQRFGYSSITILQEFKSNLLHGPQNIAIIICKRLSLFPFIEALFAYFKGFASLFFRKRSYIYHFV